MLGFILIVDIISTFHHPYDFEPLFKGDIPYEIDEELDLKMIVFADYLTIHPILCDQNHKGK